MVNFKFVNSSIDDLASSSSSTSIATLNVTPLRSAEDSTLNSTTKLSASARREQFQKSRRIMSAPIRPTNLDDMKTKKKVTKKKKVIRYDRNAIDSILRSFFKLLWVLFTCFIAPIISFVKLSTLSRVNLTLNRDKDDEIDDVIDEIRYKKPVHEHSKLAARKAFAVRSRSMIQGHDQIGIETMVSILNSSEESDSEEKDDLTPIPLPPQRLESNIRLKNNVLRKTGK